jgi:hypothetical protein
VYCCVLLCTAVCCCVLLCAAVYCCVLLCTAVCCCVLLCTAVYCCVLPQPPTSPRDYVPPPQPQVDQDSSLGIFRSGKIEVFSIKKQKHSTRFIEVTHHGDIFYYSSSNKRKLLARFDLAQASDISVLVSDRRCFEVTAVSDLDAPDFRVSHRAPTASSAAEWVVDLKWLKSLLLPQSPIALSDVTASPIQSDDHDNSPTRHSNHSRDSNRSRDSNHSHGSEGRDVVEGELVPASELATDGEKFVR